VFLASTHGLLISDVAPGLERELHRSMERPMANNSTGNRILDALPLSEADQFLSLTKRAPLTPHDLLWSPDERIQTVYFPLDGVISLITPTDEGRWVETATIGNEGMLGVPVMLGGRSVGNGQAIVQIAGESLTVSADNFRAAVDSDGKLRQILFGYAQALFAQISQSVACNGVHPVQERCARWLLQSHDRVRGDEILLTQEFLAEMLAVQRPSVTLAARTLQEAGLIRYTRGKIVVLDRAGLEAASCGCYLNAKHEYERLVGSV
jgi:CRP-like cAMP-binding protein